MPKPLRSSEPGQPKDIQFAHFGVLDSGQQSKGSLLTAVVVNVLLALIAIILGAAVHRVVKQREQVALVVPLAEKPPEPIKPKVIPAEDRSAQGDSEAGRAENQASGSEDRRAEAGGREYSEAHAGGDSGAAEGRGRGCGAQAGSRESGAVGLGGEPRCTSLGGGSRPPGQSDSPDDRDADFGSQPGSAWFVGDAGKQQRRRSELDPGQPWLRAA